MMGIDWSSFFLGVLASYCLSVGVILFMYLILNGTPNKP